MLRDNQTKQDICKICRGLISEKPLNPEELSKGETKQILKI